MNCHQNRTKNKQVRQTSYKLHGHTLDNVETNKYLGLTININLSWGRHIDNIVGKGNKTLWCIRRNRKDCTKPVKAAAYTAIVRPVVEYASTVWDPSNQDQIHRTSAEKSSKICTQQLHRPNTRLCHKYGKILKMGKP